MKIQCDVCEKAAASVICCADEAALCSKCDEQVHAANKLASKHQRLLLIHCCNNIDDTTPLSNSNPPPPSCDICRVRTFIFFLYFFLAYSIAVMQEKPAFIFCVEDRALFCQACDEPIHSATKLAATHQRFLLTGIRVAPPPPKSSSPCNNNNNHHHHPKHNHDPDPDPINPTSSQTHFQPPPNFTSPTPPWTIDEDDFLHFSHFQSSSSSSSFHKKENMEFEEIEWPTEMSLFGGEDYHHQVPQEAASAAMVPQLRPNWNNRPTKSNKKPRFDISGVNNVQDDDYDHDEYFKVPDLG